MHICTCISAAHTHIHTHTHAHTQTDQDQLCPKAVKPNSWTLQFSPLSEISHHISGTKSQINKKDLLSMSEYQVLEEQATIRVVRMSLCSESISPDSRKFNNKAAFNLIFVCDSLFFDVDTPCRSHRQQSAHSLRVKC